MVPTRRSDPTRLLEPFFVFMGTIGIVASIVLWSNVVELRLTSHTGCPTGTTMLMFSCGKVVDGVVVYVDRFEARTDEQRLLDQAMIAQVQFYALSYTAITVVCWVFVCCECSFDERRPSLVEPSKVSPEVPAGV